MSRTVRNDAWKARCAIAATALLIGCAPEPTVRGPAPAETPAADPAASAEPPIRPASDPHIRTLRFTNESDRRLHVGVEVNDPGAPGIGRAMDPGESGDISVLVRPGVADLTVEVEEMNFFSIGEPRERQEPCPDRTTKVMLVNRTRWLLRMTVTALGTEAPLELRPGMGLAGELLIPDEASEASIVVHEAVAVEPETPQEEEAIRRAKELMDWWRSGFDEIESMRERAPTEPDE